MKQTAFRKGDRVRISALGRTRFLYPKRMDRRGVIVGPGEYPATVRVRWEGQREVDALAEAFLELEK